MYTAVESPLAEPTMAHEGTVAYAFSHSQDLIEGIFAYQDDGQNYKNLALIIKAFPQLYEKATESTLYGCPKKAASGAL